VRISPDANDGIFCCSWSDVRGRGAGGRVSRPIHEAWTKTRGKRGEKGVKNRKEKKKEKEITATVSKKRRGCNIRTGRAKGRVE